MKYLVFAITLFFTGLCAADVDDKNVGVNVRRLSLSEATLLWQKKNREVQLSRDQVDVAAAAKLGAGQRPNPQLSFNSASIHHPDNPFPHGADSIVRIDQMIERGNKHDLRVRAADLQLNAAKNDFDDSRRQGLINLEQAYYDLMMAQEVMQIARDNAGLYAKTREVSQLRVKSGDLSPADLSRIDVDRLRAENDVQVAQNGLLQAQLALAYQMGVESDAAIVRVSDSWPSAAFVAMPSEDELHIALENRPDVQAARQRVDAADAAFDLAQALRKRDVTVGVQVEHNGDNRPMNSVGFGISVPLMTGYEYEGEIAGAQAGMRTANDCLEQVRALARNDIRRAYGDLFAASARIARYESELLQAANRAVAAAEFGYQHGAISLTDLLDARRTHKATLVDAAIARADYAKALAAWTLSINPSVAVSAAPSSTVLSPTQYSPVTVSGNPQ